MFIINTRRKNEIIFAHQCYYSANAAVEATRACFPLKHGHCGQVRVALVDSVGDDTPAMCARVVMLKRTPRDRSNNDYWKPFLTRVSSSARG